MSDENNKRVHYVVKHPEAPCYLNVVPDGWEFTHEERNGTHFATVTEAARAFRVLYPSVAEACRIVRVTETTSPGPVKVTVRELAELHKYPDARFALRWKPEYSGTTQCVSSLCPSSGIGGYCEALHIVDVSTITALLTHPQMAMRTRAGMKALGCQWNASLDIVLVVTEQSDSIVSITEEDVE